MIISASDIIVNTKNEKIIRSSSPDNPAEALANSAIHHTFPLQVWQEKDADICPHSATRATVRMLVRMLTVSHDNTVGNLSIRYPQRTSAAILNKRTVSRSCSCTGFFFQHSPVCLSIRFEHGLSCLAGFHNPETAFLINPYRTEFRSLVLHNQ